MMHWYEYNGYEPFGGGFAFIGPVLMVLFWVAVIILIVYLIRGDL